MAKRDYEGTHPWISFALELGSAPPRFWMLLGEARSKCDHIKFVPLAEETARDLNLVYFAKGVNATTAIEGNSLSEEQVRERLEGELELPTSKEYLGVEIDNMIAAYNGIIKTLMGGGSIPVNIDTLCSLNKQILSGLKVDPHVVPGELRQYSVHAGPYVGAPWSDIPYLLERLCKWLETLTPRNEESRIPQAIIKAVTAHVYLEWIHPFGDGNGRLGRLVEFLILISSGIAVPAAHVLTSHYNDTRTEYYRQLNEASRNGELTAFLEYAAQGLVDGLTAAIKRLHAQQEELMWHALVDEALGKRQGVAASRQRQLAIALGHEGKWTTRPEIRKLSQALELAYTEHAKMLTRDLNRLRGLGFIELSRRGARARLQLVRGMRPFVVSLGTD